MESSAREERSGSDVCAGSNLLVNRQSRPSRISDSGFVPVHLSISSPLRTGIIVSVGAAANRLTHSLSVHFLSSIISFCKLLRDSHEVFLLLRVILVP